MCHGQSLCVTDVSSDANETSDDPHSLSLFCHTRSHRLRARPALHCTDHGTGLSLCFLPASVAFLRPTVGVQAENSGFYIVT